MNGLQGIPGGTRMDSPIGAVVLARRIAEAERDGTKPTISPADIARINSQLAGAEQGNGLVVVERSDGR